MARMIELNTPVGKDLSFKGLTDVRSWDGRRSSS